MKQLGWFGVGLFCVVGAAYGSGGAPAMSASSSVWAVSSYPQAFQVSDSSPCLSLEKVYAAIAIANRSRWVITDAQIIDDGSPVSQGFTRAMMSDIPLGESQLGVRKGNYLKQNDCSSIAVMDAQAREIGRVKILEASPTRLVTEKRWIQDLDETKEYTQMTLELVSSHAVALQMTKPHSQPHANGCGEGRESHEVFTSGLVEFGDILGIPPQPSSRLVQMGAEASASHPAALKSEWAANEESYCSQFSSHT